MGLRTILLAGLFAVLMPVEVPRQVDATAQLELAARCKQRIRGLAGEERARARQEAIDSYRAVRVFFPQERDLGAEASFRAGELLRAAGQEGPALAEFARAEELGERALFEARAGLEIGHLHRRGRRLMKALAAYERVMGLTDAERSYRDEATHWAGRVHENLGRAADARRLWERVAREGVDPLDRIRAFDAWALSLLDEEDLEGSAGVLELCRKTLRDVALEETRLGGRVRGALERMRAVDRLARAVEVRRQRRSGEGHGTGIPPAAVSCPRARAPGARFRGARPGP